MLLSTKSPKSQNYRSFRTNISKQRDKTLKSILGLYSESNLVIYKMPCYYRSCHSAEISGSNQTNFPRLCTKTWDPPKTGIQAGHKVQFNPARGKLQGKCTTGNHPSRKQLHYSKMQSFSPGAGARMAAYAAARHCAREQPLHTMVRSLSNRLVENKV